MQASCGKDKVSKPDSMDLLMEDMLKGRQGKRAEKEQGNQRIQSDANSVLAWRLLECTRTHIGDPAVAPRYLAEYRVFSSE